MSQRDPHVHRFFDNYPYDTHCEECGVSQRYLHGGRIVQAEQRRLALASGAATENDFYAE